MAERKAVNKYYPPEWTPQKGSVNKFRGSHPLRERARKLHMGILIIRFEMPYNIWCEGCGNHIGMGVRYNAEKTKVGMYYTTPIYKFRMKCHLCSSHFEMQTDPQNLDYVILNGARRQERRWDPTQNEQVAPDDKDVSKKLATDAMFQLEHGVEDKNKQKAALPSLAHMEEYQKRWKDDYTLNKILRQKFREKKKELKAADDRDKALLIKSSLSLPLLPETSEDAKLAGLLKLAPVDNFETRQKQKREEIESRPLFSKINSHNPVLSTQKISSHHLKTLPVEAAKRAQCSVQQKIQTLTKPLTAQQLGIVKKNNIETVSSENHNQEISDADNEKTTLPSDGILLIQQYSPLLNKSQKIPVTNSLVPNEYGCSNSESESD